MLRPWTEKLQFFTVRTKTLYPRYAMNQFGLRLSKKSNKRKHIGRKKSESFESGREIHL